MTVCSPGQLLNTCEIFKLHTAVSQWVEQVMPAKKRSKVRSLTGGERERSKARTAWLLALSRSDTEAVRERPLTEPGLASTPCHLTGLSPCHWAVKRNNRPLLSLLVTEYGASPNTRARAGGHTPLHMAAIYNRREMYR